MPVQVWQPDSLTPHGIRCLAADGWIVADSTAGHNASGDGVPAFNTLGARKSLGVPGRLPSAFAPKLNVIKGRTVEGESCDCTDPPKKKKEHEKKMVHRIGLHEYMPWLFAPPPKERANNAEVFEQFAKKMREAGVKNANLAMKQPAERYKKIEAEFKEAVEAVKESEEKFQEQMTKYHEKFLESDALHHDWCTPMVEDHYGIPVDCEVRRLKEADRFLARVRHPDCMVGHEVTLDAPQEASLAVPAAILVVVAATNEIASSVAFSEKHLSGSGKSSRPKSARHSRKLATFQASDARAPPGSAFL